MHPHEPPIALIVGTSAIITFIFFALVSALIIYFVNKRLASLEREARVHIAHSAYRGTGARMPMADPGDVTSLAPLWYVLSFVFWPASLCCAIFFMQKAETARMGRNCAVLGLVHFMLIGLMTCLGMFVASLYLSGH